MKTYEAKTRLWWRAKKRTVEAGETIELSEESAKVLLAKGAIATASGGEAPAASREPADEDEKQDENKPIKRFKKEK